MNYHDMKTIMLQNVEVAMPPPGSPSDDKTSPASPPRNLIKENQTSCIPGANLPSPRLKVALLKKHPQNGT